MRDHAVVEGETKGHQAGVAQAGVYEALDHRPVHGRVMVMLEKQLQGHFSGTRAFRHCGPSGNFMALLAC